MKIVHVGLAELFTEGMTYQGNLLSHQNVLDGHEVVFISNAQKYQNGQIVETGYEDIRLADGMRLIRLPFDKILNDFLSQKIRKVKRLYDMLEELSPDVMMSHSLSYGAVEEVIRYKRVHPSVKLYADTHANAYNSGVNWLSLHILHRMYYRHLTQKALPYLEKYLFIGEDERIFSIRNYHVPESIMEYYPLGGIVPSDEKYNQNRMAKRHELGVGEGDRLYIHSGKLDEPKRTEILLRAFIATEDERAKMVIIGAIPDSMKPVLEPLIKKDKRISFLGWKSGSELQEYLCACDMYCQPGSLSATMQNAICNRCAIMAYPHLSYKTHLDRGEVMWVETQQDIENTFISMRDNPEHLDKMKNSSMRCAEELLDYRKLAARLYK